MTINVGDTVRVVRGPYIGEVHTVLYVQDLSAWCYDRYARHDGNLHPQQRLNH